MSLLSQEKQRQIEWKRTTKHLSPEAKKPGMFRGKPHGFCLPPEHAAENLFEGIRKEALQYFSDNHIHWHLGAGSGLPSNHLCSSQVLLVNFLFPFMHDREALKLLFQPIYPDIERILPIEKEGQYLAFEWTPPKDLLREATNNSKTLRRGMANTSIDFAFLYRSQEQQTVMVLGECKYTEPVPKTRITPEDTSKRLEPYLQHLTEENNPFIINVKDHPTLFGSDEYYQLFRQQLLSSLIGQEYQGKINRVCLMHLFVPGGKNSKEADLIQSHYKLWHSVVCEKTSFSPVRVTTIISSFQNNSLNTRHDWLDYIYRRYLGNSIE